MNPSTLTLSNWIYQNFNKLLFNIFLQNLNLLAQCQNTRTFPNLSLPLHSINIQDARNEIDGRRSWNRDTIHENVYIDVTFMFLWWTFSPIDRLIEYQIERSTPNPILNVYRKGPKIRVDTYPLIRCHKVRVITMNLLWFLMANDSILCNTSINGFIIIDVTHAMFLLVNEIN